jgi:hypothetical protein
MKEALSSSETSVLTRRNIPEHTILHNINKNIRDLYRGINEFKRGYQPRNNLVKDENGDVLADSNNVLNRGKNYFLVNEFHSVNNIWQVETHTTEQLLPGRNHLEAEIAVAKLKEYKSPGSDQSQQKYIKQEVKH